MEKRMDTSKKAKHLAACTAMLFETATRSRVILRTHRVVFHKYLVSRELSYFHFSPEAHPGPSAKDRKLEAFGFLQAKMPFIQQLAALVFCASVFYAFRRVLTQKRVAKLPPGPKGKPIIGNLLDLPPSGHQECIHWFKHKEIYGA